MLFFLALASLPVIGALLQIALSRRERRLYPPPGLAADAGGTRLHFRVSGKGGPLVVLDSALAATSLSWSEVQPKVATFTRVVSYDRGGFGWSGPSSEPRRADVLADELRRGLKVLSLEPPYVLVGHSYGGFVVKLYAARHPGEVAGMVLVDVPHPKKWTNLDDFERKRIEGGARAARRGAFLARIGLLRLLFRFLGPRRVESLPGLLSKLPDSHRSAIRSFWVRPSTLRALASLIEETPRSAVLVESACLDLGDKPLAVLTAASPSPERVRDQEEEARRSRRSRHVVAERSGHWIPLEEPDLVVEAIREVTDEVRRLLASGGPSGPEAEGTREGETTPSDP